MSTTEPTLPHGWRKWATHKLYRLLNGLDDSTQASADVLDEIRSRESDPRF